MPSESELMPQSSGGLFDLKSLMQIGLQEQHYQRQIERENALRSVGIMTQTLESYKNDPDRYNNYLNNVIKANPVLSEQFQKVNMPLEQFNLAPINTEAEARQLSQKDIIALRAKQLATPEAEKTAIMTEESNANVVQKTVNARNILAMAKGQDAMAAEEAGMNSEAGKRVMETKFEQQKKIKEMEVQIKQQSNPVMLIGKDGSLTPTITERGPNGEAGMRGATEWDAVKNGFNYIDSTQAKPIYDAQQRLKGDYSSLYAVTKVKPDQAQQYLLDLVNSNKGPFANEGSMQSAIARLNTEYLMATSTDPKKYAQAQAEYELSNKILEGETEFLDAKDKPFGIPKALEILSKSYNSTGDKLNGTPSPFYFSLILAGKDKVDSTPDPDIIKKLNEAKKRTDDNIQKYKTSFKGITVL